LTMTMSEAAIERGTGRRWSDWLTYLDGINAADMSHTEIARNLTDSSDISGWWAQAVTVAYEQHIGRRVPGQDCDGEFSVSVSKTLNMSKDDALNWWLNAVKGKNEFSDVLLSGDPEITKTEKWRYWRAPLADGSRPSVHIYEKAPEKSSLSVMHERLESQDQIDHWRAYWKQFLKEASSL
jgi:hypothetical protein